MQALRVLFIEDEPDDALLVERALRRAGYLVSSRRVQDREALRTALAEPIPWDIVISDYNLPSFSALEGLEMVKALPIDLPFVIVSGSIGEESAVEALKSGAADFTIKNNLERLVTAVRRELRDVQTRKERRDAIEALEEAVRARDDFLAIASHELRTPLTSLQLQLQRLARAIGEGRGAEGADPIPKELSLEALRGRYRAIARSADRMQSLVERLLDVTRLTSGARIELVCDDVDLSKLVEAAVRRALGADAPPAPVLVRTPVPVRVRCDEQRIDMAVSNLVDNAFKYCSGRPIEISVEATPRGGRVAVVDHGLGIPIEAQRRIFERFERAVPVKHFGGFGLGLWLARQVVEAHGGSITVESEPGEGSKFALEIPRFPTPV
jgi:signal transduction histidine kinase